MAVFTAVSENQIAMLAGAYGLPAQLRTEGIAEGVENTNYLLYEGGQHEPGWVLTLLEKATELDYVHAVLASAHRAGLPVPLPLATGAGKRWLQLDGRAAVLTPHIAGVHPLRTDDRQCNAIGRFLGRLHARVAPAGTPRPDPQGLDWLFDNVARVLADEPTAQTCLTLLKQESDALQRLPACTCHGDLFRDNALFQGDRLAGVIDWYNAAHAPGGYDLAIVLNDWCLDPEGRLVAQRVESLLAGYRSERSLDPNTARLMPLLRAWAALRFWTSRTISAQRETKAGVKAGAGLYQGKPPVEQSQKLVAALDPVGQEQWTELSAINDRKN